MSDELKKKLGATGLVDEDTEFFAYGLIAMLQRQQKLKNITDLPFRRKITALFRLYDPLLIALYMKPVELVDTYLLWENNFFNKIPLVHHRDQARTDSMECIAEMVGADLAKVEESIQERAELLLDKLEKQRERAAAAKAKKDAKAKSGGGQKKKPQSTFTIDGDDAKIVMNGSLALMKYPKDILEAIEEVTTALDKMKGQDLEVYDQDQAYGPEVVTELTGHIESIAAKVPEGEMETVMAGLPVILAPQDGDGPGTTRNAWVQDCTLLRFLRIVESQCQFIPDELCARTVHMVRFAKEVAVGEVKRLNALGSNLTNKQEGDAFVAGLKSWMDKIEAEVVQIDEDWSKLKEESDNIQRKKKFARYVSIIKNQKLSLDGDMDNMFQIKKQFKSSVKKAMLVNAMGAKNAEQEAEAAAAKKAEEGKALMSKITQNRAKKDSDSDGDSDDDSDD
eukprot:SAG22_NODE_204_length_15309_cov_12.747206_3_plen_451_part_00